MCPRSSACRADATDLLLLVFSGSKEYDAGKGGGVGVTLAFLDLWEGGGCKSVVATSSLVRLEFVVVVGSSVVALLVLIFCCSLFLFLWKSNEQLDVDVDICSMKRIRRAIEM